MESSSDLIDDHLDGELTSDDADRFAAWLREGDAHVREFATQWLVHSLLHDYMSQRQVQADALLRALTSTRGESRTAAVPDALLAPAVQTRPTSPLESVPDRIARFRYWLVGTAAGALILLAVGTSAFMATRPQVAAMLTQTHNCRWENSQEAIAEGALFHAGDQLRLVEGRALITFVSGARLVIEGPTLVTVEGELAADLSRGALTARVPAQAIGFTVHAPRATLIDLGTEFTVRTTADGGWELQVFDGMVELTLLGADREPAEAPLQITEGTAVKAGANSQGVEAIAYDANQRMTLP